MGSWRAGRIQRNVGEQAERLLFPVPSTLPCLRSHTALRAPCVARTRRLCASACCALLPTRCCRRRGPSRATAGDELQEPLRRLLVRCPGCGAVSPDAAPPEASAG